MGTSDRLLFGMGKTSTITESGGNVGIGTSTPTEKLEVNGNIKCNNEVSVNSCNNLGSLGFILVDSVSTSTLSTTDWSFTASLVELGMNSTVDFNFYTMIIRGDIDGNGGIPNIDFRFQDLSGDISDTNSYQNQITAFGGGGVVSNRNTNGELMYSDGANVVVNYMFGEFRMSLGNPTTPQLTNISGQVNSKRADGTGNRASNVISGLTNLAVINTQIQSIGFRANNVNSSTAANLQVRIFRMY